MKIIFLSFQKILFYLISIQSSSSDIPEDIETFEETRIIDNPLFFSFDKDTFENFESNFNDEILTHKALKSPPFYINESVKNILSIFCLIFQYSLIKHNADFKETVEKLFEITFIQNEKNLKGKHDFNYDRKYFLDNLIKLDEVVKNICKGNLSDIVSVQEENDRIIITQLNSSVKLFNFKLLNLKIDNIDYPINNELINAIIEFYTMLNESYLQDQLKESYLFAVGSLQYIVGCREERRDVDIELPVHPPENLIESCATLYKFIKEEEEKEDSDLNETESDEENPDNTSDKHSLLFTKLYVNRKFPLYLDMLQSKASAKSFYGAWKDINNPDSFYLFPIEFKKNLYEFLRLLICAFKNDDIVKFQSGKLKEESLDNLVKNCLEFIL